MEYTIKHELKETAPRIPSIGQVWKDEGSNVLYMRIAGHRINGSDEKRFFYSVCLASGQILTRNLLGQYTLDFSKTEVVFEF